MLNPSDEEPATAVHTSDTSGKRRRIRKGTRSCWECKRRKTKCIFASAEDVTCLDCQRRRVPCVSQEVPEDLSLARKSNWHLGERIARIEDLIKDIIDSKGGDRSNHPEGKILPERRPSSSAASTARLNDASTSRFQGLDTPIEHVTKSSPIPTIAAPDSQDPRRKPESEAAVLDHLLTAYPKERDVVILLTASAKTSLYTNTVNLQPHSKWTPEILAKPCPMTDLPSPDTHPVIVARYMLMFAITLQSPTGEKLHGLSEPNSVIMHRLMIAATTWVTTNQDLHGSVESLICIMLEGIYEINCGNLRRAWGVYRRAMTVAQLMGLHRSPIPPLKRIEPRDNVDPEFMWFRIVYMDRYLSLLLGLPQASSARSIGDVSILQDEPLLGKFERRLTAVASRILERNESTFSTSTIITTQSIDAELLNISKIMPSSFWRPANFYGFTPGSPEALLEILRLAAQVYYYGILIQLHLPYMMHGISDNSEHEYSKITCVNASRESLVRFIAHRTFNPMSSCSRPVDFFALLAAMTLLLAHIDAHHHAHHHQEATNYLVHQRLSDRALLDQTLERMEVISELNKDAITDKSAKFLRRLLDIEADAADGGRYSARSVREHGEDLADGSIGKEGEDVRLSIPYLGIINIAREGPVSRLSVEDKIFRPHQAPHRDPAVAEPNDAPENLPHVSPIDEQQTIYQTNNKLQNFTFSEMLPISEWPDRQVQEPGYDEQSLLDNLSHYPDREGVQPHAEIPTITSDIDDWAFEGVDMAFFDSLMRGTSFVETAESEQGIGG